MSIMHNRDTRVATFIGGALDGKIQHFAQALTDEYTIATSRARVGDVIDVTGPVKIENEVYRLEKLFVTLNAPEPEAIFYVYVLRVCPYGMP